MFLASFVIYFIFAIFAHASLFKKNDIVRLLQYFFLISFSINIILGVILSLLKILNQPFAFLSGQIIIIGQLALWLRKSHPLSIHEYIENIKINTDQLKFLDWVLIGLIGLIQIAFFVVILRTPPNNLDSLDHTHLTKILYWLQNGSIDLTGIKLSTFFDPLGVHFQGVWLFLLGKSENFFCLIQWFALLITAVTIYRISRLLKFSSRASIICSLISMSFPAVLLQTYSFQGDLVVATFILVCISLSMSFLLNKQKLDLVASFVAFVLALYSKRAAYFAIPVLLVFVLVLIFRGIKNKKIAAWIISGFCLFTIVGVIFALRIIDQKGGIIGGYYILPDQKTLVTNISKKTQYNLPRYLYQMIGFDGLPRYSQGMFLSAKAELFKGIFEKGEIELEKEDYLPPGYDTSELFSYSSLTSLSVDGAWFGPLAFMLLPLSLVVSLFSKEKIRRRYAIICLSLFISFFLLILIQRPGWDPYQGRYFILPILPCVPLIAILFSNLKKIRIPLLLSILPLSLFISFNTFFSNETKPIINAGTFWGLQYKLIPSLPEKNKIERFAKNKILSELDHIANSALDRSIIFNNDYWGQVYYSNFDSLINIRFIDQLIPNGATVYQDLPETSLEYGFFGRYKDRTVFRISDLSEIHSGYYVTLIRADFSPTTKMIELGENDSYRIYFIP